MSLNKAVLTTLGFLISLGLFSTSALALEAGDSAPCVELTGIQADGSEKVECVSSKASSAKYTVLEFFSTTCGPCIGNLPNMNALFSKFSSVATIRLVGIDRNPDQTRSFVAAHKEAFPFTVALDNNRKAAKAFQIVATPETFIIDDRETVIYHSIGSYDDIEMAKISEILSK